MRPGRLLQLKPRPTENIVRVNPEDWDHILNDDPWDGLCVDGKIAFVLDGKTIVSDPYIEPGHYAEGREDKRRLIAVYQAGHMRCRTTLLRIRASVPDAGLDFACKYLDSDRVDIVDGDLEG